MASISQAYELIIILIFVNNEHFVNIDTMGSVACGQNANSDAAWTRIRSNLAKAIICTYKNEINIDHFEHLM